MIPIFAHGKLLSTGACVFLAVARWARRPDRSRSSREHGSTMLAKLSSYTLVGIDATPVEVEVDVSSLRCRRPSWSAWPRRPSARARTGSSGPGQLRIPAADRSGGDQPGPGGSQERRRRLRSADRAGAAAGQRAGRVRAAGLIRDRRRARADRRDPADQRGPGDGPAGRRREARGPARPGRQRAEAAVVEGIDVYPVGSLAEAVGFLSGQVDIEPESVDLDEVFRQLVAYEDDFVDVKGQDYAKRAL